MPLADAVIKACEGDSQFDYLYDVNKPLEEKIEIIAKEMYGADGISLSDEAKEQIANYTRQGERKTTPSREYLSQLLIPISLIPHFQVSDISPFVWPRPLCPCRMTHPRRVFPLDSLFLSTESGFPPVLDSSTP